MSRPPTRSARFAVWTVLTLLLVGAAGSVLLAGDEDDEKKGGGYGNTPSELEPFRGMGEPYHRYFTESPVFRGPGGDDPEPEGLTEARIGVLLPYEGPDVGLGKNMLHGITLAIEEANAAGGLRQGLPFRMLVRDEAEAWGAAANAAVELVTEKGVWALVGALGDENSHVLTRVLLKLEVPMINTAGPDPTLTEHMIPWLVRMRPDDRQTGYVLAKRIFQTDKRRRVAVLRANNRYARMGIKEFVDAARRLHKPIAVEMRYEPTTSDWSAQIERLKAAKPDALVLWGRGGPSGRALKAVREAGLDVPVYGPDRLANPAFLAAAGKASEGVVFTYPFSPSRAGEAWQAFTKRFQARFGRVPDAFAAYAYDGTRKLVAAMRQAGLNRVRIREALYADRTFGGVTGPIRFDPTFNNVSEIVLGHVSNGALRID